MNREERLMRNIRLGKVKKGFTLVELLIVIIIIAVLAAIAIPKFANSSTRSKESALRSNLKILRDSVELFKADTSCYPSSLADLAATTAPTSGLKTDGTAGACTITSTDWRGPYVQVVPTDPTDSTAAWTYVTTGASVGKVNSSSTGYTTW